MKFLFSLLIILSMVMLTLGSSGCADGEPKIPAELEPVKDFLFTSTAFGDGETIPVKYTCQGDNVSPPLQWSEPPQNTRSFALISDDPDGSTGIVDHWVLYNLPAETRDLPEGIPIVADLADGSHQGKNVYGRLGYTGPCPPSGIHRYVFRLYALDTMLDMAAGATKSQLLQAMDGHILAQSDLMGRYSKQ